MFMDDMQNDQVMEPQEETTSAPMPAEETTEGAEESAPQMDTEETGEEEVA